MYKDDDDGGDGGYNGDGDGDDPTPGLVPVLVSRSTLILDDEFLWLEQKKDRVDVLPCLQPPERS